MEQYINKADVIAELNRLIAELVEEGEDTMFEQGRISAFEDVKVFINHTLEVNEVQEEPVSNDLEAELIKWHNNHFKKKNTFVGMSGFYLTNNNQLSLANHFAQWQKERLTDKAVKWLTLHDSYSKPTNVLVEDFRKAIEEE